MWHCIGELAVCGCAQCCFRGLHDRIAIGTCLDNRVLCGRSDPAAAASVAFCPSGLCSSVPIRQQRERGRGESEFQFSPLGTDGRCRLCRVASAASLRAAGRRRRRRFISSVTAHEAPSIHLNHPTIHIFGRIYNIQSEIPRIVAGVRRRPLSGICLSVCQSSKCHLAA